MVSSLHGSKFFFEFGVVNDDQFKLGAPGKMRNHEARQEKWDDEIDEINRRKFRSLTSDNM